MEGNQEDLEIVTSGEVLQHIVDAKNNGEYICGYDAQRILEVLVKYGKVYARMSPTQKATLVQELQDNSGEMVAM